MPCVRVGNAIVCSRGSGRKRCVVCRSAWAERLCDWKVEGGTCDAPLCATCSTEPAPGKDLCPAHAAAWIAHPKSKTRNKEGDTPA